MAGSDSQGLQGAGVSDPSDLSLADVSDPPGSIQRGLTSDGPPLRLSMSATVVKGFGRGSKLLGIPTANMDMKQIGDVVQGVATGIYFGYTMLRGTVYQAVVSVGWNPYFDNQEKTVEPHLLHEFQEDFYGEELHLLLCGFIRKEQNFKSVDNLITAIKGDIEYARVKFEEPEISCLATNHPLWMEVAGRGRTDSDRRASAGAEEAEAVAFPSHDGDFPSGSSDVDS